MRRHVVRQAAVTGTAIVMAGLASVFASASSAQAFEGYRPTVDCVGWLAQAPVFYYVETRTNTAPDGLATPYDIAAAGDYLAALSGEEHCADGLINIFGEYLDTDRDDRKIDGLMSLDDARYAQSVYRP